MPVYLAEMERLEHTYPLIFNEFEGGNWVVNKNEVVPFCAVGSDTALENVNRSLKVRGGLVGITLNSSARNKFFLVSPYMSRLAEEAELLNSEPASGKPKHHKLSPHVLKLEEEQVYKLTNTLHNIENPFEVDSDKLFNMVTKKVALDKVKEDVCNYAKIGEEAMQTFLSERIVTRKVNLWARLSRVNINLWKEMSKKMKVKSKGEKQAQEFSADRAYFARMLIIGKSRKYINFKNVIGTYELSIIPRSMFAQDGSMLHCSCKSALIDILLDYLPSENHMNEIKEEILEKIILESLENIAKEILVNNTREDQSPTVEREQFPSMDIEESVTQDVSMTYRVVLIDGMAELQAFEIGEAQNCLQLASNFISRIMRRYGHYDEIRIIFDRYDLEFSLKETTRKKRLCGQSPTFYKIADSTPTIKMKMKNLLSHDKTKDQLTVYLSKKLLDYGHSNDTRITVSYRDICESSFCDSSKLSSSQEEADTKLILHAVDATKCGATHLDIYSDDTDVLVLAIRRVKMMTRHTRFVSKTRIIDLNLLQRYLGDDLSAALPAFHAISGADITGSFSQKGKISCWMALMECPKSVLKAFKQLGTSLDISEDIITGIEKYICKLYALKTNADTVEELRWLLFKKKQAHSEELPPTKAALQQAILRAHYQLIVWNNDIIPNPDLPSPLNFGWYMDEDNSCCPVMTDSPPAPDAIISLVKCRCPKSNCSKPTGCSCAKATPSLYCTGLCECSRNCENEEDDHGETVDDEEE